MTYATVDDVAVRIGRVLTAAEQSQVGALLQDVSGLVESFCRRTFDPVPPAIKAITCNEVIRLFNTTPGLTSEETGDVRAEFNATGGLTRATKDALRPYRSKWASIRLAGSTWAPDTEPTP